MYSNMKASKAVIGLQQITSHGSLIEITNYKNNENIEITFLETGYKKIISWRTFQKNKNPRTLIFPGFVRLFATTLFIFFTTATWLLFFELLRP